MIGVMSARTSSAITVQKMRNVELYLPAEGTTLVAYIRRLRGGVISFGNFPHFGESRKRFQVSLI
jgi:hypothetical protein